jgi:hypothetical protein
MNPPFRILTKLAGFLLLLLRGPATRAQSPYRTPPSVGQRSAGPLRIFCSECLAEGAVSRRVYLPQSDVYWCRRCDNNVARTELPKETNLDGA